MVAACEACRNLKMRCSRSGGNDGLSDAKSPCDRCKRHNRPCKVLPPRPSGRKPGSLGRYRGVEKALRKIQTELRKAKSSSSPNQQSIQGLLQLTEEKDDLIDLILSTNNGCHTQDVEPLYLPDAVPQPSLLSMGESFPDDSGSGLLAMSQSPSDHISPQPGHDSISNPLGLVADACGEAQALDQHTNNAIPSLTSNPGSIDVSGTSSGEGEPRGMALHLLTRPGYVSLGLRLNRQTLEQGLDALLTRELQICRYSDYFKTSDVNKDTDTGPDLDPIDLGLVSMEDAHYLFPLFFARLHPMNGILDPLLHTPEFVRSRSALLFTWILAISAQFDHASGLISKRLRIHGENLSKYVHAHGYKSVEIAQGYYISLLSAVPANTMAEERSWLYTNYAFGVAAELGLDRPARPLGNSNTRVGFNKSYAFPSRRIETSVAGGGGSSPLVEGESAQDTTYAERLARNRERTWLRILLWERAHSAARGRVSAFPETELTLNIETWYLQPLADPNDKYTCAFILLRRHLSALHDELKRQQGFQHTSRHWVRELIDSTLQPWCLFWLERRDEQLSASEQTSRTFLRYVYMHGRLWTLSFALHGNTSQCQDFGAIKEDCFEAAVNCCETIVQDLQEIGEPIYCMLAPTWAMTSYAAVLALRLFPLIYGEQSGSQVELLALLAQVALQLERVGTTPSHRFGIAALLGQHLFVMLRNRANMLKRGAEASQTQRAISFNNGNGTDAGAGAGAGNNSSNIEGDAALAPTNTQPDYGEQIDLLTSTFDPFLTNPFLPGEEDGSVEGFTDVLWDWLGQGFGGVT